MRLIRMSADSRLTEFPGPPSYDNSLTPNKQTFLQLLFQKFQKSNDSNPRRDLRKIIRNDCSLSPKKRFLQFNEIPRFNSKIPSIRSARARNSSNEFREFSKVADWKKEILSWDVVKMDVRNRNEIQIEPRSFAIKPVRNEAERWLPPY